MKATRARPTLRLKGTLFALAIAAVATQAGSAPLPPRVAHAPHSGAASVSLPGEGELLASLSNVLRGPPVSGSWALLLAGLTGISVIGRRRMSALEGRILGPPRLLRE